MVCNEDNVKDINKYFQGTYIVVPEVSLKEVYYVYEATYEGIVVNNPDSKLNSLISFENNWSYTLKSPLVVRKQWYQDSKYARLISRLPARMWKKGICSENTIVQRLSSEGTFVACPLSHQTLQEHLKFLSPEKLSTKDKMSIALDNNFAFSTKSGDFFLWNTLIGKISVRSKEIFLARELGEIQLPSVVQKFKVHYV